MSKIIKNCCVTYNELPRTVHGKSNGTDQDCDDGGYLSIDKAFKSAENSLKDAFKKSEEIAGLVRIESQIAFSIAHKSGVEHGYADALNNGLKDSKLKAKAKINEIMNNFISCAGRNDTAYIRRLQGAKDECIDFAFRLAENVLNMEIDRSEDAYKVDLADFMNLKPRKAIIEVDGCEYVMDTLKANDLMLCAKNIEGIRVDIVEEPVKLPVIDEEVEADTKLQEVPPQTQVKRAEVPVIDEEVEADTKLQEVPPQTQVRRAEVPVIDEEVEADTKLQEVSPQIQVRKAELPVFDEEVEAETKLQEVPPQIQVRKAELPVFDEEVEADTKLQEVPPQIQVRKAEFPVFDEEVETDTKLQEVPPQIQVRKAEFPVFDEEVEAETKVKKLPSKSKIKKAKLQTLDEKIEDDMNSFKDTEQDVVENTDYNKNGSDFHQQESENRVSDEKFVYIRPSSRLAVLPSGVDSNGKRVFEFEDILHLSNDNLKLLTRKVGINDIAAAFQGAPQEAISSILEACPRKIKEKVLDGMKYLGPVPETQVQEARIRLAHMADELALH